MTTTELWPHNSVAVAEEWRGVVTFFPDEYATQKEEQHLTLLELRERILRTVAPTKEKLPWLKLARFGSRTNDSGCLRNNDNVLEITGIELDYDGELVPFNKALAVLQQARLLSLIYTTARHTVTKPRFRLLLPTSRALAPEWRWQFVDRIQALFDGIFADESRTLSQCYYYGRVVTNPDHRAEIVDGDFIDLRADLDTGPSGHQRSAGSRVHERALLDEITTGEAYHRPVVRLVGKWFRKGVAFAEARRRVDEAFEQVPAGLQDARWRQRRKDVDRCLLDIYEKEAGRRDDAAAEWHSRFAEEEGLTDDQVALVAWLASLPPIQFAKERRQAAEKLNGVDLRELKRLIKRFNTGDPERDSQHDSPYRCRDDGVYHLVQTEHGTKEVRLSNFNAEISEIIIRDDGSENLERSFVVTSGAHGTLEVSADDFDAMTWVTTHWGPHARCLPGHDHKPHLANAIKSNNPDPHTRTIYGHTGWRRIGGEYLYLHAGGAIGADGPVGGFQVELSGDLSCYSLPTVRDLPEAVRASLRLFDLGPFGALLVAAAYRAPVSHFAEAGFSIFLEGASGAFKSACEGVAQAHFGAGFDGKRFPGNWTGTANSLEKLAYAAKDALFTVDDFAPKGGKEMERQHEAAERLLRAQANRSGRTRMNADGSLRSTYYPRGIVAASGEDVPKGHSLRSRMVIIHVDKDQVNLETLTRLQRAARDGLLAEAMAGYVQWIAGRADTWSEILPKRLATLRTEAQGDHARTADNIANLLLGIELLLMFAVECGAIDADERTRLHEQARANLGGQIGAQDAEQAAEKPAVQFLEMIGAALAAGRVHLAARDGQAPTGRESECGWRVQPGIGGGWRPNGDRVGWIEGDDVYLEPNLAFAAAERLCREQNRSLGITKGSLGKRLSEAGVLKSTAKDRNSITFRAESQVERGYHLEAAHVLPRHPYLSYRQAAKMLRGLCTSIRKGAMGEDADHIDALVTAVVQSVEREVIRTGRNDDELPF